jgi:hypothetical protein
MQTWKKAMNATAYQQVLADVVDGMRGVMNDKHLEVRVMGQQTNVENVVPLVASGIVEEEEMQASENVEGTFNGDDDQIEMDIERTMLMIKH